MSSFVGKICAFFVRFAIQLEFSVLGRLFWCEMHFFHTHTKQADTCAAVGYFRVCNVVVLPKGVNKLNINMLNCWNRSMHTQCWLEKSHLNVSFYPESFCLFLLYSLFLLSIVLLEGCCHSLISPERSHLLYVLFWVQRTLHYASALEVFMYASRFASDKQCSIACMNPLFTEQSNILQLKFVINCELNQHAKCGDNYTNTNKLDFTEWNTLNSTRIYCSVHYSRREFPYQWTAAYVCAVRHCSLFSI